MCCVLLRVVLLSANSATCCAGCGVVVGGVGVVVMLVTTLAMVVLVQVLMGKPAVMPQACCDATQPRSFSPCTRASACGADVTPPRYVLLQPVALPAGPAGRACILASAPALPSLLAALGVARVANAHESGFQQPVPEAGVSWHLWSSGYDVSLTR